MGCLTFRLTTERSPSYLADSFLYRESLDQRFLRPSYRELVPFAHSTAYQKSFIISATGFWNDLPEQIKRSSSLPIFKNILY